MKFAICNETFQDWPLDKAFDYAASCGYTGVEIAPFTISEYATDITPQQRDAVRRQAEAAGLEIVGIHWLLAKTEGFYMTSPDKAVREKTSGYFGHLAKLCADLGGKVMVCGSPQQRNLLPGVSHDEAMYYAADMFRAVVPELERNDVQLLLEPLAPAETDFMQTAALACELADAIGSPHVQLHLDCKAMSSESKSIPELIRENRDRMLHFHANDPNKRGPGMGELDFVPILAALEEIGYDGWVSVEVFDYSPGIERLATESIEYLNKCWKKVAGR